MSKQNSNIGWLFYRDYYAQLAPALKAAKDQQQIKDLKLDLEKKNSRITANILEDYPDDYFKVAEANAHFQLKTDYPGMLTGLGTQHSVGHEDEIKLGFSFDHTTGLPYLPASSVKGLFRSVFPSRLYKAANNSSDPSVKKALQKKAENLQKWLLGVLEIKEDWSQEKAAHFLHVLEEHIFAGKEPDGNTINSYKRDIFFDAYPIRSHFSGASQKDKGRFLGLDALTPHGKNKLKNPVPLRLLKVLPEVVFQFQMRLEKSNVLGITVNSIDKLILFKETVACFGMGAKTNVGYGSGEVKEK